MGGNTVFLHKLKEKLAYCKTDLALALYAAANGVGAGVEHAVFARHTVLEQQVNDILFFIKEDVFGFTCIKCLHIFTFFFIRLVSNKINYTTCKKPWQVRDTKNTEKIKKFFCLFLLFSDVGVICEHSGKAESTRYPVKQQRSPILPFSEKMSAEGGGHHGGYARHEGYEQK